MRPASPVSPAQLAQRWIDAFNRHELEELLALYADDAVHRSPKLRVAHPETGGLIRGKAALRAWWNEAFQRLPTLRYKLERVTADHESVFIVYERTVEGQPLTTVAECFLIHHGLITQSSVFHG